MEEILKQSLYEFDLIKGEKIVGVDEAGRGPLAGPVVAAATILKKYDESLKTIQDSKKLTEKKREALFSIIPDYFYVGIGRASVEEIETYNILNATFLAMRRALANLGEQVDIEDAMVLVDGNFTIRECKRRQEAVVKGDAKSLSIAAASIMAKVTRDHELVKLAQQYPAYLFEKHKGYGTKVHREKILSLGPIPGVHRASFLMKILQKKK
ncbi:MAG TPA: ribonuclease HII [Fusobacterium sp.]|uniref:ribonuclease HII n=1 Tax=Fusobacterium sp. TaxID=68766 RepID=UPI002F3F7B65